MTLHELDQLMEDTRRAPRVEDRVAYNMALAVIEIARQLSLLNEKLGGSASNVTPMKKAPSTRDATALAEQRRRQREENAPKKS